MVFLLRISSLCPDDLRHAPFLSGLAATGWVGSWRNFFGPAYLDCCFRGATPAESGYTHHFRFDPVTSPFAVARHLPDDAAVSRETADGLRNILRRYAATQVGPYPAAFLSPHEIPLALLPCFDLSEQSAPWETAAHRPSVFEELDLEQRPWIYLARPLLQQKGLASDRQIVARAIEDASPETALAYLDLSGFDAAGHAHGPGSRGAREALLRVDALLESLLAGLRGEGLSPRLLLFGGHGMVKVDRRFDVQPALKATKLRTPNDFGFFVEPTCVRFWYRHPAAQERVRAAVPSSEFGDWLSEGDRRRYGIPALPHSNGEDFFMARPGVVFTPDFLRGSAPAPAGMHGYAPDIEADRGVLLLSGPGFETPRALGAVPPLGLHAMLRSLLFGEPDSAPPLMRSLAATERCSPC